MNFDLENYFNTNGDSADKFEAMVARWENLKTGTTLSVSTDDLAFFSHLMKVGLEKTAENAILWLDRKDIITTLVADYYALKEKIDGTPTFEDSEFQELAIQFIIALLEVTSKHEELKGLTKRLQINASLVGEVASWLNDYEPNREMELASDFLSRAAAHIRHIADCEILTSSLCEKAGELIQIANAFLARGQSLLDRR